MGRKDEGGREGGELLGQWMIVVFASVTVRGVVAMAPGASCIVISTRLEWTSIRLDFHVLQV